MGSSGTLALGGRYFEDYRVGEEFVTPSRTITETDIVLFAGLTSDFNPLHTDQVFASKSVFRNRIAHGMLTLSIAMGLISRLGLSEGTIVALVGMDKIRFQAPVKIGDTLKCTTAVMTKKDVSDPRRGLVTFDQKVQNQEDVVVLTFQRTVLFLRRGEKKVKGK